MAEDNPWGMEAEEVKFYDAWKKKHDNPRRNDRERQATVQNEEPQKHVSEGEIDMDSIIASLQQKKEEAKGSVTNELDPGSTNNERAPSAAPDGSFDPTNAFQRDGAASERFSPKDLRVKAATNDYETVQRFLSISTEFIDRQDKNGWSALHFASRSGHLRMIKLLLEHGGNPYLKSVTGQTPLDVAVERFGEGHAVTQAYNEYMHGNGQRAASEKVEGEKEPQTATKEINEKEVVDDVANDDDQKVAEHERKRETAQRKKMEERRKKLFQPILEDEEDDDVQVGRSRLDTLLKQPPRKSLFADEL